MNRALVFGVIWSKTKRTTLFRATVLDLMAKVPAVLALMRWRFVFLDRKTFITDENKGWGVVTVKGISG